MSSSAPPPPPSDPTDPGYQPPPTPPAGSGYPPPASTPPTAAPGSTTPTSSPGGTSPAGANPLAGAHKFDLAQIGLGLLMLIASLMPFYSYSVTGGAGAFKIDVSESVNAWHGFFGWFGVLLAVVAAGVLAASLFAKVAIPSMRLIVLGLFAASAVCLIIALFVVPGGDVEGLGIGFSSGHSFGYWLALLCSLAATALAFMRKDATDTSTV